MDDSKWEAASINLVCSKAALPSVAQVSAIGMSRKEGLRKIDHAVDNLLFKDIRLSRPQFRLDQRQERRHEEVLLCSLDHKKKPRLNRGQDHLEQRDEGFGKPR